ncbi:MAG: hypothetical protein H0W54_01260 [Rubrobacter sp.]|nr:hypothetical protein [Rubrobacter sp.]
MTENGHARRSPGDYKELDELLYQADKGFGSADLYKTSEALKRASVKAASMWGIVGGTELPAPARSLISLANEVQRSLNDPNRDGADAMRRDLDEIRRRFATEASN